MKRKRPLSLHAQTLIASLAIRPRDWYYGYELMKSADIKSGTLYPILMRLEERGLLESQWQAPETVGKPARHAYRLTDAGLKLAHELASAAPRSATSLKEQFA